MGMRPSKKPQHKLTPKNQEYEKLRAVWYNKLKVDGFVDIEQDEENLKVWSTRWWNQAPHPIVMEAKAAYYQLAERFLEDYKFKNKVERIIWEYHANAISIRNIVKLLKQTKLVKRTNRDAVYDVIKRLKESMIKMYLPSQTKEHEV